MLLAAALIALQASSSEVTFKGAGGFELHGTLLTPVGAKNVPALVLIPGSGPTDRDENVNVPGYSLKTDVMKQIAERLAQDGVATLRYDKRAIRSYSDKWPKDMKALSSFFSWNNFCEDAKAAHDFLMQQPGIDAAHVGMLGHSEGSFISIKVASDPANKVNGLILMAGQGRPLDVVVMQQLNEKLPDQLAKAGASDLLPSYINYAKSAFAQLKKDASIPPGCPAGLQSLFNVSTLEFLHENLQDDPAQLAMKYQGDVLILNGEFDNQVSPDLDAKALERAFKSRKAGSTELMIIPGASHAFKATTDRETDSMEGPMVPSSLNAISAWCQRHA